MKERSILTPILVGTALIVSMVVMAVTNVFTPLIQFIHTGEITAAQGLLCIIASAVGFGLILKLLVMLGGYFLPQTERKRSQQFGSVEAR